MKKVFRLYRRFQLGNSPQMNLVLGFLLYTVVGFLLLCLPIFHERTAPLLDHLFISTSAISTTGLVTISVAETYNWFGEFIVMLLFQIGGIGYMSLTIYYILVTTSKINRYHSNLVDAAFTMPKTIKVRDFIKSVIVFTVVMELLGAIGFFVAFNGSGMETGQAIWYACFHSVSAFCTAGFALFGDSFEGYQNNTLINVLISVLAIAGSMGFIVITDVWLRLRGRNKQLSFTTRIILYGFLILLTSGTLLFTLAEPLVEQDGGEVMKSFFQAMTAMTTVGFNTVPIGELRLPILIFLVFLMYLGASPSGTAGGMKITTLTAMIAILKSRIRGQKRITFLRRTIPFERLFVATSTFILYTSLVFVFSLLLAFTESFAYERILFEVASALGTVGLSTGITGSLSVAGKLMVILLMFIGRVGVLTFGFALLERKKIIEDADGEVVVLEDDLAV